MSSTIDSVGTNSECQSMGPMEQRCFTGSSGWCRLLLPMGSGRIFGDEIPVHQLPESSYVIGTCVAIIDVIRVLPNIASQQSSLPAAQWRICVFGAYDRQVSGLVANEPRPAGAKCGLGDLR